MIIRIFVFYVGSVVLMALVLPYTAYSSNESPFVTFFSGIGIPHAGDVIQVVVLNRGAVLAQRRLVIPPAAPCDPWRWPAPARSSRPA